MNEISSLLDEYCRGSLSGQTVPSAYEDGLDFLAFTWPSVFIRIFGTAKTQKLISHSVFSRKSTCPPLERDSPVQGTFHVALIGGREVSDAFYAFLVKGPGLDAVQTGQSQEVQQIPADPELQPGLELGHQEFQAAPAEFSAKLGDHTCE